LKNEKFKGFLLAVLGEVVAMLKKEINRLPQYSKESIIDELKRLAEELRKKDLTDEDVRKFGRVSPSTIRKVFGNFNEAKRQAGLEVIKQMNTSDDELIEDLLRIYRELGRRPSQRDVEEHGKYSPSTYNRRFGGIVKAFYRALEISSEEKSECGRAKARPIYGELINFKGMRYAPLNREGVIFLFSKVSEALGFIIESISGTFPHCDAVRKVDYGWERVKIGFEYKSSDFQKHFDTGEYDIIVCWEHDWADCPKGIEVISLKEVALLHKLSESLRSEVK
jgi:hypothetical protein